MEMQANEILLAFAVPEAEKKTKRRTYYIIKGNSGIIDCLWSKVGH